MNYIFRIYFDENQVDEIQFYDLTIEQVNEVIESYKNFKIEIEVF